MLYVGHAWLKTSVKPFLFGCAVLPLPSSAKGTQITLQAPDACESVSLAPEGWREHSCQSNSEPLDVVCHFLWAGLASARGFEECGKTSVKERRGSVYLSLLVGHDSHFDLSADQLLDRLAGGRSHKVTVSTTKGWAWCLACTCRKIKNTRASRGKATGAAKNRQASRLVDLLLQCEWLTGQSKTYLHNILWCLVSWQLPFSSKIEYYLSLITQQQPKDLNTVLH